MKITSTNGKYFNGDKLFFVETKGAEPITLYRLFLLINQLAINESKRFKNFLPSLLFEDFMMEAIKHGKEGTSFLDSKNDWILKQVLEKCYPKEGEKKFNLYKQSRIEDFGVTNGIA